MAYREIRVRPVVRYIITDYTSDEQANAHSSVGLGMFDNAETANQVARAVANEEGEDVVFEPARQLKIDWLRGPGEPKDAIRWELSEVPPPPSV